MFRATVTILSAAAFATAPLIPSQGSAQGSAQSSAQSSSEDFGIGGLGIVEPAPSPPNADELMDAIAAAGESADGARLAHLEAEIASFPVETRGGLRGNLALWLDHVGATAHARTVAAQAVEDAPRDAQTHFARATVALSSQDVATFQRHADKALQLNGHQPFIQGYAAIADAQRGEWDSAYAHLARARELGYPDESADALQADLEAAEPVHIWDDYAQPLLLALVIWLALMGLLLVAGSALSKWTLRHVEEMSTGSIAENKALKRAYAAVLWLSCALYYLSIPLAVLVLLGGAAGLIYLFFAIGRIPVKLVALIGIGVLVTLWAVLKAVFAIFFAKEEDPGPVLDLDAHPDLKAVLHEVAAAIDTASVDTVFMTPGTDIAVFERGGLAKQIRGASERCLILGVGVLDGLSLDGFRAILAHEYGHFRNEDTAGGGFALSVRRSLGTLATHLAHGGAATRLNPVWLFLESFHKVFIRISQGASRLQEYLADRWAALAYGAQAFEDGLRHVIERSVRFEVHTQATLHEVLQGQRGLSNLYAYQPDFDKLQVAPDVVTEAVAGALDREAGPFDSHPAPRERFSFVHAIDPSGRQPDPSQKAWELFTDRSAVEEWMTHEVRQNVERNGVGIIPATEAANGSVAPDPQPAPAAAQTVGATSWP